MDVWRCPVKLSMALNINIQVKFPAKSPKKSQRGVYGTILQEDWNCI